MIRIVIADDHNLFREGLCAPLSRRDDVEVIGEASDGRSAVRLATELQPDLVLMDVAMPDLNGVDATRQILADNPHIKMLPLSMHTDSRYITQMLELGAGGFLQKDCASEEVVDAIRTVMAGEIYLSPSAQGTVIKDYLRRLRTQEPDTPAPQLTPREREVLQLLAEGNATKEVAARLGISVKTAESHCSQIMQKLGMRSLAELTKFAVREGLTELD
jgi:DNA-binding NarL/FixJ family response regulator